jgi:hypothetical protein
MEILFTENIDPAREEGGSEITTWQLLLIEEAYLQIVK